jgi:hypothetical protein
MITIGSIHLRTLGKSASAERVLFRTPEIVKDGGSDSSDGCVGPEETNSPGVGCPSLCTSGAASKLYARRVACATPPVPHNEHHTAIYKQNVRSEIS